MKSQSGTTLLELAIALALSAILFVVLDKVYANLWKTRQELNRRYEQRLTREMPTQLFSAVLFHAGNLGCRSIHESLPFTFPPNLPVDFFIQTGTAVQISPEQLTVHETLQDRVILSHELPAGSLIKEPKLKGQSPWILVSDCTQVELVPYEGRLTQSFVPPIALSPVIIRRWTLQKDTLYHQVVYPPSASQPVLNGVTRWVWQKQDKRVSLDWVTDGELSHFEFILRNT